MHLVRHRSSLKNRIHATLIAFGHPCPVSDLFGVGGRQLLERLALPEAWRETLETSLYLVDELDEEIRECERELKQLGADHPYVPLLTTIPGIAWTLGYTIAAEIGDISRFASPVKLIGYTGLCPRVYQSGESDRRGPLRKNGPRYLRWALIEAAQHAARSPAYPYRPLYERTHDRLGRNRVSDRELTVPMRNAPPERAPTRPSHRPRCNREMSSPRHPHPARDPPIRLDSRPLFTERHRCTLSNAPLTTSARATISQRLVKVLTVEDVGGGANLTPHRNDASVSRLPSGERLHFVRAPDSAPTLTTQTTVRARLGGKSGDARPVTQQLYALSVDKDIRSTPEEAARGDIPAQFVQVIGVVVRGDTAVVAQLTNDVPPYEVETAYCHREGDGWVEGSSGNSTSGYLPTGEGIGTVVVWDEAPAVAVSARFEYDGREQVVPVERGCALTVFDDVKEQDAFVGGPLLVAWIDAGGAEQELPRFDPPEWVRAKLRKYLEREP